MARSGELVMAIRGGHWSVDREAEPVTIVRQGVRTLLILDDGERLEFETGELLAAVVDRELLEFADLARRVVADLADLLTGGEA